MNSFNECRSQGPLNTAAMRQTPLNVFHTIPNRFPIELWLLINVADGSQLKQCRNEGVRLKRVALNMCVESALF